LLPYYLDSDYKISYQSILPSSNSRFRRPWEIVSCFNVTTPVTPTCFTNANFDDTQKHRFVSNSCIPTSSDILTNIVDIADSNQLPPRKPFGFTLTSNLSLLLPHLEACCPFYTNIIFRTKLSLSKSANKLKSFLERQLHHDCSQAQLLFVPQYILSYIIHIFGQEHYPKQFFNAYKILPNLWNLRFDSTRKHLMYV